MKRRSFLRLGMGSGLLFATGQGLRRPLSPNDRLTCGFIGVGHRGTYLLRTVLENLPDVEVVGVCDIRADRLERAVKLVTERQAQKPDAYGGGGERDNFAYRKMLERKDIEALVIATPCNWHYPMYRDAILAGKHFYGEKPMCISVREAEELVRLARDNPQVVITIGYQRRAHPRYQETIAALRRGEIGELIEGRAAWNNAWGPLRGWFSHRQESGDWMVEQACHTWDVFFWLLGKTPLRAFAIGRKDIYRKGEPDRDVTDFYSAIIEWEGFWLTFTHCWGIANDPAFTGVHERIIGTKGVCVLGEGRITLKEEGKRIQLGRSVNATLELLRDFFRCVREKKRPLSGVENGRYSVLIGLLVRLAVDKKGVATWEELMGEG